MSLFSRRGRGAEQPAPPAEESTAPPPEPTGPGPHDVTVVPEVGARLDLGALRVPARAGMQVRLELEKKTRTIVAVTLGLDGATMQLQVFAAPRTAGIWAELRGEIAASVTQQGGITEEVEGAFGTELLTRLPVKTPEGHLAHRPARFIGVDGPRWFLRAVLTGRAAVDPAVAARLEEVLADTVVVRGPEARPPRDVLALTAPGRSVPAEEAPTPDLDPLHRGPEITEVR